MKIWTILPNDLPGHGEGSAVQSESDIVGAKGSAMRFRLARCWLGTLVCLGSAFGQPSRTPARVLYGLNFGPYLGGQRPEGPPVSLHQIQVLLDDIVPYTKWVRTFGMTNGLEQVPAAARSRGLKVAAGAWLGPNAAANEVQLQALIAAAQAGNVDIAIVGNEVILRGDLTAAELAGHIERVKAEVPPGVLVGTAETYDRLLANPVLLAASTVILPNIYPFWQGVGIDNALCSLIASFRQVQAAAGGTPVVITEAGWPSAGSALGLAVPSPQNARRFALQFVTWAEENDVPYFYFEAFDEAWKAEPGGVGPHWGIWNGDRVLKPGMMDLFNGVREDISCDGIPGGPGDPRIEFTYIPPRGLSIDHSILQGRVWHVSTAAHHVACYIQVGSGWWTKPTFATPSSVIGPDGSWACNIVTGGVDYTAQTVAAFLLPDTVGAPPASGGALPPGLSSAVASVVASRSVGSISGRIISASGTAIAGITIRLEGSEELVSRTDAAGRYSFPLLASAGPYEVTPQTGAFRFSPTHASVTAASGREVRNFTAHPLPAVRAINPRWGFRSRLETVILSGERFAPGATIASNLPAGLVHVLPPVVLNSTEMQVTFETYPNTPLGRIAFHVQLGVDISGASFFTLSEPDWNSDGLPDLILQDDVTKGVAIGYLGGVDGTQQTQPARVVTPGALGWTVVACVDFNQDLKPDLVWQNDTTGQVVVWLMGGAFGDEFRSDLWVVDGGVERWALVSLTDLNADGYFDLVWMHKDSRAVVVWYLGGSRGVHVLHSAWLTGGVAGWSVIGMADMDRNGRADLLWQNDTTRQVVIWYYGGPSGNELIAARWVSGSAVPGWRVVSVADMDLDGSPDFVWQNDATRSVAVWYLQGIHGDQYRSSAWLLSGLTGGRKALVRR